jgi:hypothetical protein
MSKPSDLFKTWYLSTYGRHLATAHDQWYEREKAEEAFVAGYLSATLSAAVDVSTARVDIPFKPLDHEQTK